MNDRTLRIWDATPLEGECPSCQGAGVEPSRELPDAFLRDDDRCVAIPDFRPCPTCRGRCRIPFGLTVGQARELQERVGFLVACCDRDAAELVRLRSEVAIGNIPPPE